MGSVSALVDWWATSRSCVVVPRCLQKPCWFLLMISRLSDIHNIYIIILIIIFFLCTFISVYALPLQLYGLRSMLYIICVMTADQIPPNMISSGNANFTSEKERSICNCNLSSWSALSFRHSHGNVSCLCSINRSLSLRL